MNLNTAYALVVKDQQQSYPEMAYDEAVAHVFNTLRLETAPPVAGGSNLGPDDGTELWQAYKMVLEDRAGVHGMMGWMASQTPPVEASER